jgi:glycosyltransferase involved in cell wall biosynthesis
MVSPIANNAIYSHVGALSDGLQKNGHDVTLFGAGDSITGANIVSSYPVALNEAFRLSEREKKHYTSLLISKCYKEAAKYDLIHSHFTLLSSFYADLVKTPTLISIHSPLDEEIIPFLTEFKHLKYISFSYAQRKLMPELNWVANIYHGVDTNVFSYNDKPKDYVLYLGRVTEDKGVHLAIEAARQAGVQLIIAGKSYPTEGYWHAKIEKHIDGKNVRFIGEQSFEDKIEWIQNAKALIFPTQCQEVFGYVMIEAMSCGTPVIAWNNGSVPEVVKDKITGFIVNSVEEAVSAIKSVGALDRANSRKRAEQYFSISKMVSGYEKVYKKILGL